MQNNLEPSKAELDILTVIWKYGPSTVRSVHNHLRLIKEVNYTTTLKQMQLMTEKGMLERDESSMTHIYSSAEDPDKTKSHLLDKFVNHIYDGSADNLVMQLFDDKNASSEDLKIIREILIRLDQTKKSKKPKTD